MNNRTAHNSQNLQGTFWYSESYPTFYRYGFNGMEKDNEVKGEGNSYTTEFRQLDVRLGKWLSVDPLASQFPWQSPCTSMDNNPISLVDPKGLSADSPIYDENGDLLGTDDEGLEGDAIVMNKDDFQQGMSHEEAKKKDLGVDAIDPLELPKFMNHYEELKDRPDYDGKVTFGEAIKWYNEGTGDPLYVDARKINLSSINTSVFEGRPNSLSIEFFPTSNKGEKYHYPHFETGPVYGHIQVTLLNPKTGEVRLGVSNPSVPMRLDIFDFRAGSKAETTADYLYPGEPSTFDIIMYRDITNIKTKAIMEWQDEVMHDMWIGPKF